MIVERERARKISIREVDFVRSVCMRYKMKVKGHPEPFTILYSSDVQDRSFTFEPQQISLKTCFNKRFAERGFDDLRSVLVDRLHHDYYFDLVSIVAFASFCDMKR